VPIPENVSLNHIQTSFLGLLNKIWPHLQKTKKTQFKIKTKAKKKKKEAKKLEILELPS
jgi:hypothetical protein